MRPSSVTIGLVKKNTIAMSISVVSPKAKPFTDPIASANSTAADNSDTASAIRMTAGADPAGFDGGAQRAAVAHLVADPLRSR